MAHQEIGLMAHAGRVAHQEETGLLATRYRARPQG